MVSGIITLLTDFGTKDPFVGVMKGVILRRFREATLVDLTHEIDPQNVAQAAFWLARAFGELPGGTVHCAVVDPGVGSERAPVVTSHAGHWFVGPDNGLLARLADDVRRIDIDAVGLRRVSATFHGRDVFAPVAAELASGQLAFENVGPAWSLVAPSPLVESARSTPTAVAGSIATVDRFGNLITTIERDALDAMASPRIVVGDVRLRLSVTYSDVPSGELAALVNSFGFVEVALNGGSAAEALCARSGDPIRVESD